jgi:hypothetical protein
MKKYLILFCIGAILSITVNSHAETLFVDDFEGDLSAWTGKYGGSHNGTIVSDPDPFEGDHAVTFTSTAIGGDIFTAETFSSSDGQFILSFDYFGDPSMGGTPGDLGGLIGLSTNNQGSGTTWIGTSPLYGDVLPDTGMWEHVEYTFELTPNTPYYLVLEDWRTSGPIAGDAFFDNVLLSDGQGPSPVPEPATMLLLGSGFIGLAGFRRKFK